MALKLSKNYGLFIFLLMLLSYGCKSSGRKSSEKAVHSESDESIRILDYLLFSIKEHELDEEGNIDEENWTERPIVCGYHAQVDKSHPSYEKFKEKFDKADERFQKFKQNRKKHANWRDLFLGGYKSRKRKDAKSKYELMIDIGRESRRWREDFEKQAEKYKLDGIAASELGQIKLEASTPIELQDLIFAQDLNENFESVDLDLDLSPKTNLEVVQKSIHDYFKSNGQHNLKTGLKKAAVLSTNEFAAAATTAILANSGKIVTTVGKVSVKAMGRLGSVISFAFQALTIHKNLKKRKEYVEDFTSFDEIEDLNQEQALLVALNPAQYRSIDPLIFENLYNKSAWIKYDEEDKQSFLKRMNIFNKTEHELTIDETFCPKLSAVYKPVLESIDAFAEASSKIIELSEANKKQEPSQP